MKTLVVGGNRFVGVEIVWHLLQEGHEVAVLALDAPPASLRPHVRWIRADRNNLQALQAGLHGLAFDAVIDNIAYEPEHIRRLAAALGHQVGRYVMTSTTDCYSRLRNFPRTWTEDEVEIKDYPLEGLTGDDHYFYGKRSCEAALMLTGLPWTVVRPSVVTGARDNVLGRGTHWFEESGRSHFWPARVKDGGPILLVSPDEFVWNMIWANDLARAVGHVIGDPRAVGQAYNVCADEFWTNERLVRALCKLQGVTPDIVYASPAVIKESGIDFWPIYATSPGWSLSDNAKLKALGWAPTPAEAWLPSLLEAVGDPVMRASYHSRVHEIALARHLQRTQASYPPLIPQAAPQHAALESFWDTANSAAGQTLSRSALGGRLEKTASLAYVERVTRQGGHAAARADFFNAFNGCQISGIGTGTWMGEASAEMDRQYVDTLVYAGVRGINVFDTAINYRGMRAERCVGRAVQRLTDLGVPRQALLISTKGGFVEHDTEDARNWADYTRDEYLETGLIDEAEQGRHHAINAKFIHHQLHKSLSNLGLSTIDVYFLHNPEEDIVPYGLEAFCKRLLETFVVLETAVAENKIGCYGLATWEGLRAKPEDPRYLDLERMLSLAAQAAAQVGSTQHHLRVLQFPFNVRDHEALTRANQKRGKETVSIFQAATALGLHCLTSASALQGGAVPEALHAALDLAVPGQTLGTAAIQAARSVRQVSSALVGMRRASSVEDAMAIAAMQKLDSAVLDQIIQPHA